MRQLTIEYIQNFIKIMFISIFILQLNYKLLNISKKTKIENLKIIMKLVLVDILSVIIQQLSASTTSIIFLNVFIALIFSREIDRNLGYALLITTISISVNYILYTISVLINFILSKLCNINNECIIFVCILLIYGILVKSIYRIKKLNKGISFLKRNEKNEYLGMIVLNISIIIFLLFTILKNMNTSMEALKSIFIYAIIFAIIMFITIQKSLQLYYKQKLQERETAEIKEELKSKDEEIEELEKENLELNKKNHSIAHKQKSLEYELNQLLLKNEIADESHIKSKIETLSKEIQNETASVELTKTNIPEIDNMLKYMQSECIKNKIDFELQVSGNVHHMINKHIAKEDLEILLADHIKNAIIAINHSKNINKNILVRLGLIDGFYSLYIYDSGIEFKIDTLINLGIKPSTTHEKDGGTGMGFMNTFDTLKKYKASLVIQEYGKPSKDNFTKMIKIIFDNRNEYKISSYREKDIQKADIEKRVSF